MEHKTTKTTKRTKRDRSQLVVRFGDFVRSRVVCSWAFDPETGKFSGLLKDVNGGPVVIEGLWGIMFGNGGLGGDPNKLYFAAGIEEETHGLFGSLEPSKKSEETE